MRTRHLVRPALLGPLLSLSALVAGAFVLGMPVVQAQGTAQMEQYGWWLSANHDNTFTAPYSNVGPDAADMHVAYGPNIDAAENTDVTGPVNGAVEISALRYRLADPLPDGTESSIPVAVIKLALDTTYTPAASPQMSLLACPTLDPWNPDQGGNWNSRVTYTSDLAACAAGQPDSTSSNFTFTITAGMVEGGQTIDLALVPGFIPIGVGALQAGETAPPQGPWSADLKPPTDADIAVQAVTGGIGGPGFSLPTEAASVPALSSGAPPGAQPVPGGPAPQAASGGPGGYRVPTGLAANPAARLNALGRGRLVAGALLLLLFLGGLVVMALDVQRLLTPAGQAAGIGRFARPRTGPPLPI